MGAAFSLLGRRLRISKGRRRNPRRDGSQLENQEEFTSSLTERQTDTNRNMYRCVWFKRDTKNTNRIIGSSHGGPAERNPTRNQEVVGLIPGLAQWVMDLALLWLWCRLAAVASIRPLAWEPPYAVGVALK